MGYLRLFKYFVSLLVLSSFLYPFSKVGAETPLVLAQAEGQKYQASAAVRAERRRRQVRQIKLENYSLQLHPITDRNEHYWSEMLWTTALVEPQETYVAEALNGILRLTTRPSLSKPQMQIVSMSMQVGTQLYLDNPTFYASIGQRFLQTVKQSKNSQWVAMALSGLAKGGMPPRELKQLANHIRQRFPDWSQDIFLLTTLQQLKESLAPQPTPLLADLLNWNIAPNQPHLYVICESERRYLCQTLLKDRLGRFVRQNGELWSVPLLLRSLHGLDWNFFRGQTPQGIYRIDGLMPPEADFFGAYGQFPLVKLFLPFESDVKEFLPGQKGEFKGAIASYQALLPPSWRSYFPIYQSYWAGKIGRSLFRIHGSGEALDFFSAKASYPQKSYSWNPTIGCLSALELYDEAGNLQQADMPKILNALYTAGGGNYSGYAVVVEVSRSPKSAILIEQLKGTIR